MLLFKLFNNRLDDLIDSSNEKNIISCRLGRNITSFWLPAIWENRVVDDSQLD